MLTKEKEWSTLYRAHYMNINQKVFLIVFVLIISIFITACDKKEEEKTNTEVEDSSIVKNQDINVNSSVPVVQIYKEYEDYIDADDLFESAKKITNLSKENEISQESAIKRYGLTTMQDVKIVVRSNLPDTIESVDGAEMAVIQIPDSNRTMEIMDATAKRLKDIPNFSDDKKEQYVVFQKEGNLIIIISKDSREVFNKLSKEFEIEG